MDSTSLASTCTVPGSPVDTDSHNGTLVSLPLEKKINPSALEDQTSVWAGYEAEILPDKTQGRLIRNIRHQILYLYRRLFGVVLLINFSILIAVAVRGATSPALSKIVTGNLFVAILMRQDYITNAFFTVFTAVPRSCVILLWLYS